MLPDFIFEHRGRNINCTFSEAENLLTILGRWYDQHVPKPTQWDYNPVFKQLMSGKPTELTEAGDDTVAVRQVLESDCVFDDPTNPGHEIDVGGDIYWNHNRTVAVYAPHED